MMAGDKAGRTNVGALRRTKTLGDSSQCLGNKPTMRSKQSDRGLVTTSNNSLLSPAVPNHRTMSDNHLSQFKMNSDQNSKKSSLKKKDFSSNDDSFESADDVSDLPETNIEISSNKFGMRLFGGFGGKKN